MRTQTEHNIISGDVHVSLDESGTVVVMDSDGFKESISNNEHMTWIVTIKEQSMNAIDSQPF